MLRRFVEEAPPASRAAPTAGDPGRITLEPAASGIGIARRQYQVSLTAMMAATVAVLVIACFDLANLMIARASTRQRELAVRVAIGAGPGRVVRQLVTEGLVLSLCGGALGAALAVRSCTGCRRWIP